MPPSLLFRERSERLRCAELTLARDDQEESESPVGWHPLSPAVAVVRACPAGALADRPLWQSCQAHDGGFRSSFPPFAAGLTAIAAAIASCPSQNSPRATR